MTPAGILNVRNRTQIRLQMCLICKGTLLFQAIRFRYVQQNPADNSPEAICSCKGCYTYMSQIQGVQWAPEEGRQNGFVQCLPGGCFPRPSNVSAALLCPGYGSNPHCKDSCSCQSLRSWWCSCFPPGSCELPGLCARSSEMLNISFQRQSGWPCTAGWSSCIERWQNKVSTFLGTQLFLGISYCFTLHLMYYSDLTFYFLP